jgi:benzoate/toluate 1,2-dioxygenase alpha subunit
MCRGSKHWIQGPDDAANEIGLKPKLSGIKTEDEGLYLAQHQYWLEVMKHAIQSEKQLAQKEVNTQGEVA